MQRLPYIAVTYYMGSQLISSVYRNCPLNFHCATFEGITEKPLAFLPAKQQKQRPGVAATYQGEQWEPMLRFSSIGKADMQLCLPVPPQRERCRPIQPGTGNTCECADARGMFFAVCGTFVPVAWNVVGNGCVCLCSARVAMSDTRVWSGKASVPPSF